MRLISTVMLVLAAQWLAGALAFAGVAWLLRRAGAGRRRRTDWNLAARAAVRATPWAVALGLLGAGLAALSPEGVSGALDAIWLRPIPLLLLGAAPTAACHLMLHAGRLEAHGRLRPARREARLAGKLLLLGPLAQTVVLWSALLFHAPFRRASVVDTHGAGLLLLTSMMAMILAAFIGVTGGLAGKPRPSALFATLFYVGAMAALIASYQLTLQSQIG
jgi:hypothetical protein